MGRRKGKINSMGNSLLVKDKIRRTGHRPDTDSFLHTSDLQDGTNYSRINFQSVTEQSNLEDFLTTAEMAGRDFTAERQNISVITNPEQGINLTKEDMNKISEAQSQHKALLQIPRRPHWDEFTSKDQLLLQERDAFTSWRRQLKALEQQEHIELTPYEKNLDFWRQLWRVIERSDVIVQIVDARNPLLFRCEDLEKYTKEVNPNKTVMLLVNKADYLNELQRSQWMAYFNKCGIQAVFFSAKVEKTKQEDSFQEESMRKLDIDVGSTTDEDSDDSEDDGSGQEEDGEDGESVEEKENCDMVQEKADETTKDTQAAVGPSSGSNPSCENTNVAVPGNDNVKTSSSAHQEPSSHPDCDQNTCESAEKQANVENQLSESNKGMDALLLENKTDIVTAEELLSIFKKLAHPSSIAREGEIKTIGMVGYPNVGKSSTINVILQDKKLAVSATPGRTKHLQTLFVDETLMLCDCPGLVFPSFVATKAHLVTNGILPIDELRDHVSPTNLICNHIPRNILEATYSIMLPQPGEAEDPDRAPTPEELLNAYGGMRGFMTARGIPDGPRASRYLLKDFVKGKLLYCDPPPGIDGPDFQDKERIVELEAGRPPIKAPLPVVQSNVDKDFFNKRQSSINSKGVQGVKGFVRVDCLKTTGPRKEEGADGTSVAGSVAGSTLSLNTSVDGVYKPWKKHNEKRNRKEKLRRIHRDLDVH